MPYSRPGYMHYATATKVVNHGAACVENGIVGVAVKQKVAAWSAGAGNPQKQVQIGEDFAIITKGVVQVAVGALTVAKGTPVYIVAATNALSTTATSNVKYGLCVEVAGQRGTPSGFMRVDLDKKDTF